jgi:hypothetical protein
MTASFHTLPIASDRAVATKDVATLPNLRNTTGGPSRTAGVPAQISTLNLPNTKHNVTTYSTEKIATVT